MFTHIPIILPEIKTAHYDNKHFYEINGDKFPSITTILHSFENKGIEIWKARTPNWKDITDESMKIGTWLHKIIEKYLKNEKLMDDDSLYLFDNLKPELDKINQIQAQETRLYHKDLKIAGQVDCIAEYDGEKCIIDFKNSRKPKREQWINDYKVQVTAYSKMFEYCTNQKIDLGIILIANWDGSTSVFKVDIPKYEDKLLDVLEAYADL